MKAKIPKRGDTRNVKVIGMLVGNIFGKPKKYSDFKALKIPKLLAQYPKNTNFTENVLETSHFCSIWKMSRPKNTRISFLHKTFQKTLKNTRIRSLYSKRYDEHTHHFAMENDGYGGAKINYSYAEAFRMIERLFPASRSKV